MPHILLIEDEAGLRGALRRHLERSGYSVTEAANGNEALAAFGTVVFDLVVTDLLMPEKEGVSTIIDLLGLRPGMRIIAMTGGGRTQSTQFLDFTRKLGVAAVLQKPFRKSEFLDTVAAALARS